MPARDGRGRGRSGEGGCALCPGEPVAEEFRAVLPEAEESGEALVWEPGDTLGFWRDQYNVNLPFALTEDSIDDGGRRGLFYGTLYGAMPEGVSAWVYYPYDAGAAMSAQSVVTEFPGVQRCEPGRRPLVPLAGRYAGDPVWMEFAMRPLCAVVEAEVSLAAETETPVRLQSIVFHGNNGERVSGAMTVSFADEVPSVSFASDGGRTLTLDCGAGAVLAREPQRFRIVVPAGRYEQGYTLDSAPTVRSAGPWRWSSATARRCSKRVRPTPWRRRSKRSDTACPTRRSATGSWSWAT